MFAAAGVVAAGGSDLEVALWALGFAICVAAVAAVIPAQRNPELSKVANGLVLVSVGVVALTSSIIIRLV